MIHKVTITNHLGESIVIEMEFPERSGFSVRDITGLGPPKADINMTAVLANDGSVFNSAHVGTRNIVMTLGMMDNPSVEFNRQKTYKYFPIGKKVSVLVETDSRLAVTNGHVESNDTDIFSKDEKAVISILCPNSYLYSLTDTVTKFSGRDSLFQFPWSNESLTESLLVFGNMILNNQGTVYYEGDANVGIVINIHAIGSVQMLTIFNIRSRQTMIIDTNILEELTGFGIIEGDDITISTVKGNKFVYLTRNGVTTNILNALDKSSDWFEIEKGDNLFSYIADAGQTNLQFSVSHKTAYEGV